MSKTPEEIANIHRTLWDLLGVAGVKPDERAQFLLEAGVYAMRGHGSTDKQICEAVRNVKRFAG